MPFQNRVVAGIALCDEIVRDGALPEIDCVVGMARGGMPLAAIIAQHARIPLHAFLVDDIQSRESHVFVSPYGNAMIRFYKGAKKEERWYDSIKDTGVNLEPLFSDVTTRQRLYESTMPHKGAAVLLVDDGIVSGKSARFAIATLRMKAGVSKVILATPVIPRDLMPDDIGANEIVCVRRSTLERPPTGMFYTEFCDVSDEEVRELVRTSRYHMQQVA